MDPAMISDPSWRVTGRPKREEDLLFGNRDVATVMNSIVKQQYAINSREDITIEAKRYLFCV